MIVRSLSIKDAMSGAEATARPFVSGSLRHPHLGQALLGWFGDWRVSLAIPATSRPEVRENALAGSISVLPSELRDYIRKRLSAALTRILPFNGH